MTVGCAISPKPEPPEASLNLGGIKADALTVGLGDLDLVGEPGTAQPPGARIRAYALDQSEPRVEATVEADGGFVLPHVAGPGEEVRLQLITDTLRSEPADVVMGHQGSPCLAAVRPLAACLELVPAKELELTSQNLVTVRNTCAGSVTLAAPRPRRELPELGLGATIAWPATLESGATLAIDIQVATQASFDEEIIFVEATAPEHDRRPITVRTSK